MRVVVYISLFLIVLGCQDVKYPEAPANLIPKGKMIDVYTEAYLSNAARSFNTKALRDQGYKLDSMFYSKFNIDSLQFERSNQYYTTDLPTYTAMFEEVEKRLKTMKETADAAKKIAEERKRVLDSIRRDSIRESGLKLDSLTVDSLKANPVKKDIKIKTTVSKGISVNAVSTKNDSVD